MSIDGYIDDSTPERLRLSTPADFDRVDSVRATCDAILVGAETIRRDDPKLLIRSESRQQRRTARGLAGQLIKVTLTAGGELDPQARFFTTGDAAKLVYAASPAVVGLTERLAGHPATDVVDAGDPLDLGTVLADLTRRGVRRLMVEGGGGVHTLFLSAGLADELHLVVAPFLIGDPSAPRFVHPGVFPQNPLHPMRLAEVTRIGDLALLRYLLKDSRAKDGHAERSPR